MSKRGSSMEVQAYFKEVVFWALQADPAVDIKLVPNAGGNLSFELSQVRDGQHRSAAKVVSHLELKMDRFGARHLAEAHVRKALDEINNYGWVIRDER